jgi:hypothetical protein
MSQKRELFSGTLQCYLCNTHHTSTAVPVSEFCFSVMLKLLVSFPDILELLRLRVFDEVSFPFFFGNFALKF